MPFSWESKAFSPNAPQLQLAIRSLGSKVLFRQEVVLGSSFGLCSWRIRATFGRLVWSLGFQLVLTAKVPYNQGCASLCA